MATTELVSPREYLASVYEPDADLVDGLIEERPMGEKDHGKWQLAIQLWFASHREAWCVEVYPEVRVRTSDTNYRAPDVLVLDASAPDEQIITHPPLVVFEILSPEDRVQRVMRKLAEYAAMGVGAIYLVDPKSGVFQRFQDGSLLAVEECAVGSHRFPAAEIARLVR